MGEIVDDFSRFGIVKITPSLNQTTLDITDQDYGYATVKYIINIDNQGTNALENINTKITLGRLSVSSKDILKNGIHNGCSEINIIYGSTNSNFSTLLKKGSNQLIGSIPVSFNPQKDIYVGPSGPLVLELLINFGSEYHYCYEFDVEKYFTGVNFIRNIHSQYTLTK